MEAFISRAKGLYNPLTINSLLSKIPQGIALDSKFSLNELIGLAVKFHHFNTANLNTYTMPNTAAVVNMGIPQDVLIVREPDAQQLLTKMFGSQLLAPTNPPPGANLQPLVIPTITVPSSTTTTIATKKSKHSPTTTTTNPTQLAPSFDPKPCTP